MVKAHPKFVTRRPSKGSVVPRTIVGCLLDVSAVGLKSSIRLGTMPRHEGSMYEWGSKPLERRRLTKRVGMSVTAVFRQEFC